MLKTTWISLIFWIFLPKIASTVAIQDPAFDDYDNWLQKHRSIMLVKILAKSYIKIDNLKKYFFFFKLKIFFFRKLKKKKKFLKFLSKTLQTY